MGDLRSLRWVRRAPLCPPLPLKCERLSKGGEPAHPARTVRWVGQSVNRPVPLDGPQHQQQHGCDEHTGHGGVDSLLSHLYRSCLALDELRRGLDL